MLGINKKKSTPFEGITEKELEQLLDKFYQEETENFNQKLVDKDAEIAQLKSKNAELLLKQNNSSDTKKLKLEKEELASQIKMLSEQIEELSGINQGLISDNVALVNQVSELKTYDAAVLSQEISELKEKNQVLEADKTAQNTLNENYKQDIEGFKTEIETLNTEKSELLQQTVDLKAQLSTKETSSKQTVALEQQLTEKEAQLQQLIAEIATEKEKGKEQMVALEQQLAEKEAQIQQLTAELEALKTQSKTSHSTESGISKEDLADILLNAKSSANNMVQKAKERETEIIEQAKSEASDIIKATEERVALSKVQSENLIEDATHQVETMIDNAKTEAEQIIGEAKERHDFFKREGDAYYANLFELATENADFLRKIKEKSGFISDGK